MKVSKISIAVMLAIVSTNLFAAVTYSGQVNISGATLFEAFFKSPASTNDYIDADGDGIKGFSVSDPLTPDKLATQWTGSLDSLTTYWLVQYRGVGSGNGLADLVNFYGTTPVPTDANFTKPSGTGTLNTRPWCVGGVLQSLLAGDPALIAGGHPVAINNIDMAVMDVPTTWFVTNGSASAVAWNKAPTTAGYGKNGLKAWDQSSQSNTLKSLTARSGNTLNLNTSSPDSKTIFDTPIAWVPIAFIGNAGTGIENGNITQQQLQHLFTTGRMPNGENLVAATRDSGSGTRNGAMNSIGIDPSWGRGDSVGKKTEDVATGNLGPKHQPTNQGESGGAENAVQSRRLAVGYTGLAGSSRAEGDALAGNYEILNLKRTSGSVFVRPSKNNVLDNGSIDSGWQVGGNETFATVGNPYGTPAMSNSYAASYINNIVSSIQAFVTSNGTDPNVNMPGDYMANNFFLTAAIDAMPETTNPGNFVANSLLNNLLQEHTRSNNVMNIPAYGITIAGKVPVRETLVYPVTYSDGSSGTYFDASNAVVSNPLSLRNKVMGDFNYSGTEKQKRNINDIAKMMEAIYNPNTFETAGTADGYVCVEIIGDFTGDGNFDPCDIRYFADGLAIDLTTGNLNRTAGYVAVDTAWTYTTDVNHPAGNYFKTTLATGRAYQSNSGWSKADIAGKSGVAVTPGAGLPAADGVINAKDIDQVCYVLRGGIEAVAKGLTLTVNPSIRSKSYSWNNLDHAVFMDLSCDMNGDFVVNSQDVDVVVYDILDTQYGDVNLDGKITAADITTINANISSTGNKSWANGDVNGDGFVSTEDLGIAKMNLLANLSRYWLEQNCASLNNCDGADTQPDGTVDFKDFANIANNW